MGPRHPELSPADRRKGESALSDFTEYVQKQQALRKAPGQKSVTPVKPVEEHDELSILDELGLADSVHAVKLKHILLDDNTDTEEASIVDLKRHLESRIAEGHGEMVFDLGLEDNGEAMGFSKSQWDFALSRLEHTANLCEADIRVLITRNVDPEAEKEDAVIAPEGSNVPKKDIIGCSGKVLVRSRPQSINNVIEIRIAVVGNVDAGKSTMLGVLVKGGLDDGRGKARVNLFRHKHEVESGRTSSVGMEIMGFDTKGNIVSSDVPGRKLSWEEIGKRSAKVMSFTDLAGHERYLRTTVFGLLSSEPNYCLLMVAANNGLIGMSKEHLGIALALNVPVMVVITKIDICPPNILQETITQLTKILKSPGARKIPVWINDRETCIQTAEQFVSRRICPIFQVSNVTGQNLDLIRTFLNVLPHHGNYDATAPFEFHVNDTFSVPFVGTVVSGVVKSGVVHAGDTVLLGPDGTGQFKETKIRSIERKRISVPMSAAGQSASFALRNIRRRDVRKGMVMLRKIDPKEAAAAAAAAGTSSNTTTNSRQVSSSGLDAEGMPLVHREFIAEVLILSHATTIRTRYQAMLHVGPVSQTCAIIDIDRAFIRTGDRATVAFRFVQRPEYLAVGDRILFREGRTKGLGVVKALGYDASKPLNPDAEALNSGSGNAERWTNGNR